METLEWPCTNGEALNPGRTGQSSWLTGWVHYIGLERTSSAGLEKGPSGFELQSTRLEALILRSPRRNIGLTFLEFLFSQIVAKQLDWSASWNGKGSRLLTQHIGCFSKTTETIFFPTLTANNHALPPIERGKGYPSVIPCCLRTW